MSLSDPAISDKGFGIGFNDPSVNAVSLNDLFSESMRKAQAANDRLKVIVRCETLPLVRVNQRDMTQVFDTLIALILSQSVKTSTIYLYIDCEESKESVGAQPATEGWRYFSIRFHTNISTTGNWRDQHADALQKCSRIVASHQGTLQVNSVVNTGCLYTISLPGKLQ